MEGVNPFFTYYGYLGVYFHSEVLNDDVCGYLCLPAWLAFLGINAGEKV